MITNYFGKLFTSIRLTHTDLVIDYIITGDIRDFYAYRQNDSLDLNENLFPERLEFWKIRGEVLYYPYGNKALCQNIITAIEERLLNLKINWINHSLAM